MLPVEAITNFCHVRRFKDDTQSYSFALQRPCLREQIAHAVSLEVVEVYHQEPSPSTTPARLAG